MQKKLAIPLVDILQSELQSMTPLEMGRFQRLLAEKLPDFIRALAQAARGGAPELRELESTDMVSSNALEVQK